MNRSIAMNLGEMSSLEVLSPVNPFSDDLSRAGPFAIRIRSNERIWFEEYGPVDRSLDEFERGTHSSRTPRTTSSGHGWRVPIALYFCRRLSRFHHDSLGGFTIAAGQTFRGHQPLRFNLVSRSISAIAQIPASGPRPSWAAHELLAAFAAMQCPIDSLRAILRG